MDIWHEVEETRSGSLRENNFNGSVIWENWFLDGETGVNDRRCRFK